ncbi:hypothetical protein GCM10011490_17100 [Pseudoclavibacter endophyticus]|uniref:Glutaredoxin family protein n=1 Tax=Pseudoclavibacter endophyticus TaxID=1778590 RepID=A0A6H9WI03_9MICO|nr:glutaredoxin family protein [Pseudoclavibacter endophyticus]KAB1648933.1 glutaredoxin family protein [Pseudoclavibacter endophyticus]GGA67106.1 hypothetical protein GCM10011490_17100 [Pseudoclavibacter endophyticus]
MTGATRGGEGAGSEKPDARPPSGESSGRTPRDERDLDHGGEPRIHELDPDTAADLRGRLDFSTRGRRAETDGRERVSDSDAAKRADPTGSGAFPRASTGPDAEGAAYGHRSSTGPGEPTGGAERPVLVELYGKPGCHLCDEARPIVEAVVEQEGATLVEHDILADATLTEKYGEYIPVVLIDGRQHATWRVDAGILARAIRAARRGRGRWWGRRIQRLR